MSEKFEPGEETFDESEGHGWRSSAAPGDEDTEGHVLRRGLIEDDEASPSQWRRPV